MDALSFLQQQFDFDATSRQVDLPIGREELAALFGELGFRTGAEIGVERGLYSEVLCQAIQGLELYAVDAWQRYPGYREHVSQEKLNEIKADAYRRLSVYPNVTPIPFFSDDEGAVRDKDTLDFVYIDGNHEFLWVATDIANWSNAVRSGGIVAGHDFIRRTGKGYVNHVKDVVQAWTYAHAIRPLFVCRGDKSPSWFYVKCTI